jgi:hypothetical protein
MTVIKQPSKKKEYKENNDTLVTFGDEAYTMRKDDPRTEEAIKKSQSLKEEKMRELIKNGASVFEGINMSDTRGETEEFEEFKARRATNNNLRIIYKKLGPEGELVAAATQGVFTIGEAFTTLGDTASTASEKAAAGMKIMSSINDIMQANSKAKMAGIDQDIEAEKKRDGKSKESVAKIKALEKKKEGIARKAFEMNKKMQIAGALVDTASAVTGAL